MKKMSSCPWLLAAALMAAPASASAERLTLPAAASVVGAAPFFSDVRLFNTSYTSSLTMTATYRCFIGTCSSAPQTLTIGPRQSMAFDNICVSLFSAPNSAGAIEFESSGSEDQLVVTSRLYSTSPVPTVGMFVPGLTNSAASAVTILTSIANGGPGAGFRANAGAFNPNDVTVVATFRVFDGGVPVGPPQQRTLGPHSGTQINNIFGVVGAPGHATTNAVVVVESDSAAELFSYAAVIDNATTDPVLVLGAEDLPAPPGFTPPPTSTPSSPTPTTTPTPTPTPPAATVVNFVATQFQWSINGGESSFTMHVGQTYELRIRDGDPPGTSAHGFSGISGLGVSAASLTAGGPAVVRTVTPGQTGTFLFACNRSSCGTGHFGMTGSIEVIL